MTLLNEAVPTSSSARAHFYQEIDTLSMTPLWESLHALVPREPQSPCVAALWRYMTCDRF